MRLPFSQKEYDLRDPIGKDLREIAKNASKDLSEFDLALGLITILAEPAITMDELDLMDAEDVTALMSAIKSKRAFHTKKGK